MTKQWGPVALSHCFIALLCLALYGGRGKGAILAKSKLSLCAAKAVDDTLFGSDESGLNQATAAITGCQMKVILAVAVRSGQSGTESIVAEIRDTLNGTSTVFLRNPFRVLVEKSEVNLRYPIHYLGTAWNHPAERVVRKNHFKHAFGVDGACRDGFWEDDHKVACGFRYTPGNATVQRQKIMYSQGFCCVCSGYDKVQNQGYQRSQMVECAIWGEGQAAGHCLDPDHDKLKYDVFTVGQPHMDFKITVTLETAKLVNISGKEEFSHWENYGSFILGPTATVGRTHGGQALGEFLGNLEVPTALDDLSLKYLLIPHTEETASHPQVKDGPGDYLFVDKHMVDLTGRTCDVIGVSYEGFNKQHSRCRQKMGSCLNNQPYHLWTSDKERIRNGLDGQYLASSFGKMRRISNVAEHKYAIFKWPARHQSILRLEIKADDVIFVSNRSPGKITSVEIANFESLTSRGKMFVAVKNTGKVKSDYTVSIEDCGIEIAAIQAQSASIPPRMNATMNFTVYTHDMKGRHYSCKVRLFSQGFDLLDSADVSFETKDTCFCFGKCGCFCDKNGVKCPVVEKTLILPRTFFDRIWYFLKKKFIGKDGPLLGATLVASLGLLRCVSKRAASFCRFSCRKKDDEEEEQQSVLGGFHVNSKTEEKEKKLMKRRCWDCFSPVLGIFYFFYLPLLLLIWIARLCVYFIMQCSSGGQRKTKHQHYRKRPRKHYPTKADLQPIDYSSPTHKWKVASATYV